MARSHSASVSGGFRPPLPREIRAGKEGKRPRVGEHAAAEVRAVTLAARPGADEMRASRDRGAVARNDQLLLCRDVMLRGELARADDVQDASNQDDQADETT